MKYIIILLLCVSACQSETESEGTTINLTSADCKQTSTGEWRVTVPFAGVSQATLENDVIVKVTQWGNVSYQPYRAVDGSISFHCVEPAGFAITLLPIN